jgi:Putative Flp pilus-assembly TadE/G-like
MSPAPAATGTARTRALRSERGQAVVLNVLFLGVLLGVSALVLDIGSWYRADRAAQAAADASALAGAQALGQGTSQASTLASQYVDKNGGGTRTVTFSTKDVPNDTITVSVERPAQAFFSKIVGLGSVTVHARASARGVQITQPRWAAPIVVKETNPLLQCTPDPCFGQQTTLNYYMLKQNGTQNDGAGSFGFINLNLGGGNPGTSELGSWIMNGLDAYMPLGNYDARTGNPFSSTAITDALTARIGSEIMLPIYRTILGTGSNAKYQIVGWVGFHLTGFDFHGSNEKLNGYFTRTIWEGLEVSSSSGTPSVLGSSDIQLVE